MHPFESKLLAAWRPDRWREVSVLIAVSGGADSVALLRALAAIEGATQGPGRLCVGHFNHQWRGAESDADAEFVARLAVGLGLKCNVGRPDAALPPMSSSHGDSREGRARDERYAFLQRTAEEIGARYVVTAHTADDQAETILHHILRGTGLSGLAGMRPARELGPAATLVRPLLAIRRAEVLDYLAALGQDFRTDATNADVRYTRSRIRHDLLPRIESEIQPNAVDAICRLGQLAGEAHDILAAEAAALVARHVISGPARVTIDCRGLEAEPAYLVRELLMTVWRQQGWPLREMTLARWEELAKLLRHELPPNSAISLPGSFLARRSDESVAITRASA